MTRLPLLVTLSAALGACSDTCPTPDSLNGRTWTVFVHPAEHQLENADAFPADTTPANGTHELAITWTGREAQADVTVAIDGQEFGGRGQWNETECGNFSVGFNGAYEAGGDRHSFVADATLVTWEQQLDGFLDWRETWESAEGEVGSFVASAQLTSVELSR
jgi:hypothetical protein